MSNGQLRHVATMEERGRCALAIRTQIDILHERIRSTTSTQMKQVWAIAIIELSECARVIERPMRDAA